MYFFSQNIEMFLFYLRNTAKFKEKKQIVNLTW